MQRLEVSGAIRPIYGSLGVKRLIYCLDDFLRKTRQDEEGNLHTLYYLLQSRVSVKGMWKT